MFVGVKRQAVESSSLPTLYWRSTLCGCMNPDHTRYGHVLLWFFHYHPCSVHVKSSSKTITWIRLRKQDYWFCWILRLFVICCNIRIFRKNVIYQTASSIVFTSQIWFFSVYTQDVGKHFASTSIWKFTSLNTLGSIRLCKFYSMSRILEFLCFILNW